jgi:hypothetical protein
MNVLGRVGGLAGRVGGVAGRVGGAVFGQAKEALTATTSDEDEVELQLQRIANALTGDYRREAMGQLKELIVGNSKVRPAKAQHGRAGRAPSSALPTHPPSLTPPHARAPGRPSSRSVRRASRSWSACCRCGSGGSHNTDG